MAWREFEATWWGRFLARRAYNKIKTPYKILAELRGKILVGEYENSAGIIALSVLYSQLGLNGEDVDKKIDLLERLYLLRNKKKPEIITATKEGRLNSLELLCASYVWENFHDGRVSIPGDSLNA